MVKVSTYLNFNGNTEEAFLFYKSVFGNEFEGNGIVRMGDFPPMEGQPPLSEEDKKAVMHVELKTIGDHSLMGTDATETMGFTVEFGNNIHINLETDTKAEADKLFAGLSASGKVTMEMQDAFWGDYFGSCIDKFGINWMFTCRASR